MQRTVAREYYETLLIVVVFAMFARTFVFGQFKIPSGSMESTLLVGDYLVVNRFLYGEHLDSPLHALLPYREPRRGDVVVFKDPNDPRRDLIKRCVAVAGDTVELRQKQLYVNGEPVDEPYIQHTDPRTFPDNPMVGQRGRIRDNFGPRTVPEGRIFCMGDNRDYSHDSRFFGSVPVHSLKGRAVFIYWSFEAPRDAWQWHGVWHRVKSLARVVLGFFTHTRWERSFDLIE